MARYVIVVDTRPSEQLPGVTLAETAQDIGMQSAKDGGDLSALVTLFEGISMILDSGDNEQNRELLAIWRQPEGSPS